MDRLATLQPEFNAVSITLPYMLHLPQCEVECRWIPGALTAKLQACSSLLQQSHWLQAIPLLQLSWCIVHSFSDLDEV